MNVSIFKQIKDTSGGHEVDIMDVFDGIISGHWMEHVERVRNADDKKTQREIKKTVPYFTPSGTFQHRRDDGLIQHSGILAIDIDDLDDPKDVKSWLALDRFSWFTCESISGNGLVVFVKIDADKHLESFQYLEKYYWQNYELKIDQSCKDISRPRFVTFDPDGVFNQSAERLSFTKEKSFDPDRIIGIAENMIRNASDGTRHNNLLRASRLMGGYIGSGLLDEHDVIQRLKSCWMERPSDESYQFEKTIEDGIGYGKNAPITIEDFREQIQQQAEDKKRIAQIYRSAREILRSGREWDKTDVRMVCESLLINADKVEKIFKQVFDEERNMFDFDNKPKHAQTEMIIADKWEFRRNIVTQSIDCRVRKNKHDKFEPVNFYTVTRYAIMCGIPTSLDKIKLILQSDFVPEYDPLKTYFINIHQWDQKTDYIQQFASHVRCEDQQYFETMFKKHLVRAVGQVMNPSMINRFVLVLVGEKQATGKSTFIRTLSPFPLGEYYTEAKVRDDKDGQFAFAENFIYNIEELSDMKNNDVNRLKAMISSAVIKERKPYAHEVKAVARRCSFFGSTNNAQFLTDTENTRWLCHNVKSIDWGYTKINIHDLWSQAFHLYMNGFDAQLTAEESKIQSENNKTHEVTDAGKELISRMFKVVGKHESGAKFYTNTDILELITAETNGQIRNLNERKVGINMTQLGFINDRKRVNGHVVRGYYAQQIVGQYSDDQDVTDQGSTQKMF